MAVFNHPAYDEHEQVVFCRDEASGLKAIIAVHNTRLGAAFGGCRMWNYASDDEALTDVLRLARGMTYKNALAGLAMGGGKAVIIADPTQVADRAALFRAFGRFVNQLGGSYYSAEDVGTSPADLKIASETTPFVAGLEGKSGDPSPFTALGTYLGIKAAVKHKLGRDSLKGLKIAVQGIGHVGYHLCRHLYADGAELVISDIHPQALAQVAKEFNAITVAPQEIYSQDVDVFAPCALGATLNDTTLPLLQASIIAGCANNQLAEPRHGEQLQQLGILYAPDYVINAGGIINVSFEAAYDVNKATAKVEQIYQTLMTIFREAEAQNRPTAEIADEMARKIINAQ
ncbi:Leu/Phe/Val dehydrogenase [Shewanella dokdonensis]|uniref:Glu/Leu/Phe/Val dehydrogenase n=1 Tax=Shewanella dokdonensis TaxID=712036 RepID=A0ABX8DER1_9GAMM|nr:Glu/Leu/Phe/Val dehydrogenase [Shewanella dokdonensis]MCL1076046.1 amino acid dehydrogenase [Shewanella dokdonensis]QVK23213.1 Glu/Leu/Phe/Val dehydrogenase [Shewanella dokdonensis]